MTRHPLPTLLLAAALLAAASAAADTVAAVPPALAPYITIDEYYAAGLHRLNPAERERFERWFLRTVGAGRADAAQADAGAGAEAVVDAPAPTAEIDIEAARRQLAEERRALEEERRRLAERAEQPDVEHPGLFGFGAFATRTPEIEATLDGTFTGWQQGTRFRLDNGQVWEAVAGERFRPVRPLERPGVTIRRMAFGSFMLRVDGYNASVRVRRVE